MIFHAFVDWIAFGVTVRPVLPDVRDERILKHIRSTNDHKTNTSFVKLESVFGGH